MPPEAHRWCVDDTPAFHVDLYRTPIVVREVEVDLPAMSADSDTDRTPRTVEASLRADGLDRRSHRLRVGRAAGLGVVPAQQPFAEARGLDRPGLTMTIDIYIGIALAVVGVGQVGH